MKLHIDTSIVAGVGTTVELDGTDVSKAIRGMDIQMRVGDVVGVNLDVLVRDGLTLEGDVAHIDVPQRTENLLKSIGWLPPLHALGKIPPAVADRLRQLRTEYADLVRALPFDAVTRDELSQTPASS